MAKVNKTTRKNPKTKAGTEITPEIADALAAEAERGYDPFEGKAPPSRPPLAGGCRRLPAIEFPHDPRSISSSAEARQRGRPLRQRSCSRGCSPLRRDAWLAESFSKALSR